MVDPADNGAYILNKWNREDFMNDIKARVELLLEYGADGSAFNTWTF